MEKGKRDKQDQGEWQAVAEQEIERQVHGNSSRSVPEDALPDVLELGSDIS